MELKDLIISLLDVTFSWILIFTLIYIFYSLILKCCFEGEINKNNTPQNNSGKCLTICKCLKCICVLIFMIIIAIYIMVKTMCDTDKKIKNYLNNEQYQKVQKVESNEKVSNSSDIQNTHEEKITKSINKPKVVENKIHKENNITDTTTTAK
ncbi:MAG: hypothetical protein ABIN39_00730 [candidate division WOR-3 bacterium]